MNLVVPMHQFEIRFTQILTFPHSITNILSSFVPLATNIQIENENSVYCRFNLNFDRENYSIIVSSDRIVLRFEGDIENLTESNSIIESPFLSIFNKISESPDFGTVMNILCVTLIINHTDKNKDQVVENFSNKYFNNIVLNGINGEPNDVGIVLERNSDNKQVIISFGPYLGIQDLHKRSILPRTQKVIDNSNKYGEIAEIKIFEQSKIMDFSAYKDIMKNTNKIIAKLWPQV